MPHANIWIREDQAKQWAAIEDKSKFVRDALTMAALRKDGRLPISTLEPKESPRPSSELLSEKNIKAVHEALDGAEVPTTGRYGMFADGTTFGPICLHENINGKTRTCLDCGEYVG